MRKILKAFLIVAMILTLVIPAMAAPAAPQFTLQPQNYQYPEYSVAMYTVEATGTNLTATWYLEYEGKTYNLSDNTNAMEPWEGYAGENYGPFQDGNTFGWFFGGIEEGLNGAQIWCVLEDGHYDATSDRAIITVQGDKMPPEILKMPAALTVQKGASAEVRCVAKSTDDSQLEFQWYETTTGKLQDIRAITEETSDFMFCNTQTAGTRYYVCCVTTSAGGRAYSSVLPVTVTDGGVTTGKAPTFQTKTLPQGHVGEDYGFILETDDYGAVFSVSHNPGGANDFEKTGLVLTQEGMLAGKLTKAGTYTFTVCVSNSYGEDYGVLTLTVLEEGGETTPATEPEETQAPTTQDGEATQAPTQGATEGTEAITAPEKETKKGGTMKWLLPVCVGIVAAGAGVGLGILIVKKKK